MKVVSVRASRLFETRAASRARVTPRLHPRWCAVELVSDAGESGMGFAPVEHVPLIERMARDLLVGEDPRGVTGLWQRMNDAAAASPYAGAADAAIAALDLALWDLKARSGGDPLWRALGACPPRVNVHARLPARLVDAAKLDAAETAIVAAHGFRGACLEISDDPELDRRRLCATRDALAANGDAPLALMLDFDERCTPKEVERRVRLLEREIDLTWVEAPAAATDCAGFKRVSDAIGAAVCGGRHLGAPRGFLPHFHEHSLDVVQVGFQNGGITGALQIADTAFGFELPIALTAAPGNLNAHLAAALPLAMSLEIEPAQPEPGVSGDVSVEAGWAVVGDRPGHGVAVKRALFEAGHTRARER